MSGEVGEASISKSNDKSGYFAEQVVRWATPRSVGRITKVEKLLFCRTSGEVGDASISQSNYKSCYFAEQVVRWATPRSVSRITKVVICRTSGEVGDALLRLNSLFNCVFYNMGDYIASEKVHVLYGTIYHLLK